MTGSASDPETAARLARLSAGQLECLRLVAEHRSSKEIASLLGISSHTVDQRIRGALEILGVERRSEAARWITQGLGSTTPTDHDGVTAPVEAIGLRGNLPFATSANPQNRMGAGQRLLWILVIAIGAALSAGVIMAGIESVSRFLKR